ncbi:lipopolysaccharide heptosyltransferase III [Flavobacteriaceae bacterium UJ101]|nr:lipopolysaccharide heptosyltransferase III [Flavobacteriaceae bacterium UJ101]
MGDVLMASTLANNLKRFNSSFSIYFLCYTHHAQIIATNPNIDQIIKVEEKKLKTFSGLIQTINHIRKEKFDILIDPYEKTQSKLISKFSSIPMRISYPKKDFFGNYTHVINPKSISKTSAGLALDNRLALIDPIIDSSFQKDYIHPLFLKKEEIDHGEKILKEGNISFTKPIVMLGVLGSKEEKTYPLSYMGQIINTILENRDIDVLFNYIPKQKDQIDLLMSSIDPKHHSKIHLNIIGKSIREFASIMYHCDLHISNEGGGCHISKALNKPTFTIFSPYIKVEDWNTFSDNELFSYSDLKQIKPELFENETQKQWRKRSLELYKAYKPMLIIAKIENFMKKHLKF